MTVPLPPISAHMVIKCAYGWRDWCEQREAWSLVGISNLNMHNTVLCPSPLKILRSRVFHLYSSLILIGLLGNSWLKTVFVLEWPILKCLHTIKECQVACAKTYLNMQCNGKFGCALRNITSNVSVVKYWASWSFPDKNPPSRKEIISNFQWGDYCIGLWWILFDPKKNA